MLVAFHQRDARKLVEAYRDKDAISPEAGRVVPWNLRESDVGTLQGAATANSTNNTVNSIRRPEAGSNSGNFEYVAVWNPWGAEIADGTRVFLQRIWTGEWVITQADCPDP